MEQKIKNFDELAVTEERKNILLIAEEGLRSIDTFSVLKNNFKIENGEIFVKGKNFPLENRRVFVICIGKCATEASVVIEEVLGDRILDGIALDVKPLGKYTLKKIRHFTGTHPLPSDVNIKATSEIIKLLKQREENDLFVMVVSGGGSTLLCQPENGGTSEHEQLIFKALTNSGVTIEELNTLRKHLSLARGGFLAKYAYPAEVISMIFSDVPGGDPAFISSGPTMKDSTTVEDANKILDKYNVLKVCNIDSCGLTETPKEDKYFEKVYNIMLVTNELALNAMQDKARELGFDVRICSDCFKGEARDVGKMVIEEIKNNPNKSVLFWGGETTVTFSGQGKGGRNQELALSALKNLAENNLLISISSDGRDNGEYAGALVDQKIKEKAQEMNLDIDKYIDEHNSSVFFEKVGGLIVTGDTGSNVADFFIVMKT
ncbi:MAG: DUF4147 domain-containing protein [Candidatus Paceibacterota bacterium]